MAEIFNHQELYDRLEGNEELLRELVGMFLDLAPHHLEALAGALQREDAAQVQSEAHNLKGAAGAVGAEAVCLVAADLERTAKRQDLMAAHFLLEDLKRELIRFKAASS